MKKKFKKYITKKDWTIGHNMVEVGRMTPKAGIVSRLYRVYDCKKKMSQDLPSDMEAYYDQSGQIDDSLRLDQERLSSRRSRKVK